MFIFQNCCSEITKFAVLQTGNTLSGTHGIRDRIKVRGVRISAFVLMFIVTCGTKTYNWLIWLYRWWSIYRFKHDLEIWKRPTLWQILIYDPGYTEYWDFSGSLLWHLTLLNPIYICYCVSNVVDCAIDFFFNILSLNLNKTVLTVYLQFYFIFVN
jgi:hypothetical protein